MLPVAHVAHRIPQRTRLRIPAHRGDHDYFQQLKKALECCPGVREVETNPLTAGLLLRHDAPLEEIGAFAEAQELFALSRELAAFVPLARRLLDIGRAIDRALLDATHGKLNATEASLLAVLALAFYQLWRGNILPPASPLFGYALSILAVALARRSSEEPLPAG